MYLELFVPKILHYISKSSRRDTIIVNFQLSIVNSAKPLNNREPLKTRLFCLFLLKSVILKAFRTQMQHIRAIIPLSWGF